MPIVTIEVYRTVVTNGVVTSSEPFTLSIDDADNSGSITREEWLAYTGDSAGHIGGSVAGVPALWDGTTGVLGPGSTGFLYTAAPIPVSSPNISPVVQQILDDIVHAPKYDVALDDLEICFLAGTRIATPDGEVAVEDLSAGDMVLTRDNGPQPLVWVGHSTVDETRLDRSPNLRPITVAAGALGDGLPRRKVALSPQHRVLVTDAKGSEYLASARHMQAAGAKGFAVVRDAAPFTLVHIACADHQIILAEGAPMETFFTGPVGMRALSPAEQIELFQIFPTLELNQNPMTPARPFLKKKEVETLVAGEAVITA